MWCKRSRAAAANTDATSLNPGSTATQWSMSPPTTPSTASTSCGLTVQIALTFSSPCPCRAAGLSYHGQQPRLPSPRDSRCGDNDQAQRMETNVALGSISGPMKMVRCEAHALESGQS
jgi:hypothetical protein